MKRMKLTNLIPADYNPRVQLKPGDTEWNALKGSIEKYGYIVPIVWNQQTRHIVSGHQRFSVLLEQGITEANISVIDCTLEKEKQLNIAMNRIEGAWDYEKLGELFEEFDMAEILDTGFTVGEISSLFPNRELQEPTDEDDNINNGDRDGEPPNEADEPTSGAFIVYLSFPTRQQAEAWMKIEGIKKEFSDSRNITVHMEGINFGD